MTGLTDEVFSAWLLLWSSQAENTRAISDHPSTGKKWVAVVECIGFPIVVSVLINMSASLPVRD